MDTRDRLIHEYVDAKAAADRANSRLKKAQAELLDWMSNNSTKTLFAHANGSREVYSMTYVRPTRYDVDEAGLRKALRAKVYDKYTERRLNRKALELAMDDGVVDPLIVSKYLIERPGAPFVRFTAMPLEKQKEIIDVQAAS